MLNALPCKAYAPVPSAADPVSAKLSPPAIPNDIFIKQFCNGIYIKYKLK